MVWFPNVAFPSLTPSSLPLCDKHVLSWEVSFQVDPVILPNAQPLHRSSLSQQSTWNAST